MGITPIDDHLSRLGVAPDQLSDAERRALDRDGFVVMPGVIGPEWLARLRAAFEARQADAHWLGGIGANESHFSDLVNYDAAFDGAWSHPRVLAAAAHVLGRPLKLSSLNGREPFLGRGRQALHADWGTSRGTAFHVVNSLWLLDDFTVDNGATRIVPGSHRAPDDAIRALADPAADHPDELVLRATAGTVVVFNAHAWHGGTLNRSGARRRALHAYYTAREHPQQLDQRRWLRWATWRRLDPAQRWLLDVDDA